jgi:hypothetical protein
VVLVRIRDVDVRQAPKTTVKHLFDSGLGHGLRDFFCCVLSNVVNEKQYCAL